MPKTVGVAVSNATFHFDKLYTYAVMPDQQNAVKLGSMVLVPFGRGSRARMGVVLACDAEPESAKLKYLFDVAPASACLTPELLRLVHFLKERTFCTYYEAVKAVIPYGAQYKPAVAADGVTPVLQKQLTRHTENSYRLVGGLPPKPKPTARPLRFRRRTPISRAFRPTSTTAFWWRPARGGFSTGSPSPARCFPRAAAC